MGAFRMGSGPMGFDPLIFTTPAPPPPLNPARNWDAAIRAFDQLSDGTFLGVHPVDQMVQMLLTIEQGSVPALGNVGQRYRARLLGAPPQQVPTIVLDETKVAIKQLLDAGDVALLGVTADASVKGRVLISVAYQNLRGPTPTDQRTATTWVHT